MPTVPGQPVDYLRLIEQDKRETAADPEAPSAPVNPYLSLVQDERQQRQAMTRAAVLPSLDKNPDEYAGHLTLAAETGLPIGAVETDPQAVARDARLNRIADTVAKSPLLQAWALQDDNAILAMDDFENLSTLEKAMRAARDTAYSPVRGFDTSLGQGVQGLGRLYRAGERAVDRGLRAIPVVGDTIADAQTVQIPWWAHPANWFKESGEFIESTAGPALPENRRNFATDVGEGLGTLIGQAIATRINPVAGTSLMAGQGAETQGERAEAAGATTEQTDQAVVMGAAVTAAVERMGLDLLLNRMPPNVKNKAVGWIADKAIAGGIEGAEEASEQVANNYVAAMVYEPEKADMFFSGLQSGDVGKSARALTPGVWDSATVGTAVGVIVRSLLGIRSVGMAARETKAEQTTLDGLVQVAAHSKLAQRAPERFEGLVQQLAQEGAEHVYVPAETVRTLYQSLATAQVAQELGVPAQEYAEAILTGGDVAIPIGAYLTRVAPQHGEALRDVARFTPGAMTPAEAAAMDEQAAEAAERFMASVQTESPSDQRVYEDVYGMLFDTRRYRREDVEKYAQLVQAGFRTLAARTGRDAMDLYSSYRLRIKSELPVALQRSDIDTVIDPLIERLRAGDVPADTAGRGQSLAEFLAERGGIADEAMADEVRRLGESDRATRAGKARLVREGGRSLDYAREAAVEAGYLRDGADINDLLEALDDEFTGRPNRPITDQSTVELRESLDALDSELRRLDIDVSTASNQDIKRALFGESGRDVPDDLVRVFEQPVGPTGKRVRLGDLPRDMREDLFNNHAMFTNPEAREILFYAKKVPAGVMNLEGVRVANIPADQLESYIEAGATNLPPLVVADGRLIDGQHRIAAARAQGIAQLPYIDVTGLYDTNEAGYISDLPPGAINTELNQPAVGPRDTEVTARTPKGEFRLVDQAVPEMAALQTGGWTREIKAYDGDEEVGSLLYANDGTPPTVDVVESHRRRGIATAMYALARKQGGDLGSRETGQTEGGQKSARSEDGQAFREGMDESRVTLFQSGVADVSQEDSAAYAEAITSGRKRDALRILHRAVGVTSVDHSVDRGGAHDAPDPESGSPAFDVALNGTYPDDVYGANALSYYGTGEDAMDREALSIIRTLEANPNRQVTIYRAVTKDGAKKITPGDWVTTVRQYAKDHGESALGGEYKILKSTVYARDIFTGGDSWLEWGYHPQEFRPEIPKGEAKNTPLAQRVESFRGRSGGIEFNQPGADGGIPGAIRRGYISFGGNRQFTIALLEKADATTFLHETGHFFLEVLGDLAADPGAPADLVADYQAALNWLGVTSREEIGTDQHEQWARGFEAYLGEGKAPTAELAPLFARFKAWVKAIYRTLRNLNVDLTDDVRGVFDRLLATDVEITQAETSMDYAELFKDARSAGWTDAEFATRLQLQQQAREEAEGRLMARAMRDVKRETRAWWKEREAEVREQVTADVHARPVYQALAYLANGATPDGSTIEGATKLDKGWLERQYGQAWLNKHLLRRRVYAVSGGADPDVIATGFGYSSGDALVRDLANAAPMADVIAAETRQRMIDEYGDILSDGTMPDQALRAVHGDRRFKAMEADLRALERLAGEPRPSAPQLRRIAEAMIGQRRIRDVQPNTYLRAERKAAKEAIQASGRGEWGKALEAQRRRLLNAHLFDVASKAKDETEKLRRYVLRFQKSNLRALLGKIDRLDEVDTILYQYDLRRLSGRKIDQGKAKAELLARIDAGEVIAPAGLIRQLRGTAGRTNWQDLTVEDFRGLRDVLRQIEAAAKAEHEAMVNGERVVLDEKAEAMADATRAAGKAVMPVYGELAPDETVKKWGKQALGAWLRPSALARLLDGSDDGAWTRNIIQPIRRAVVEQLEPMKRKASEDLAALYRDHYGVKEMAQMNERAVVPGLGIPLSRWDVISLALNWGNVDNRQAVLDSEVAGRKLYTEQGVRTALETLDARDWKFVQATWDYIDSYWPAIKETQRRRKGIAPPKVEADPFTITSRDGQQVELKGGYYPLKYNARLDARARQHEMDEAFDRMRAGTLAAVQSKYGHVQERVGSGKQPVLLSMNVLHSHINNVVMDLALGDAVNYVDRVLQRPQVRAALIETGNLDALETWKLWLKDTATGEIGARSGVEQMAQLLRFGFTKSKIGFNAMTVVLQFTGLAQTIPVVGTRHTAAAVADMAGRPKAAIAQVMAESAFMRARYELNTFNKDVSAIQEALRSGAPVGKGSGFIGGFINAVRAVQLPPSLVSWAFFGIRQVQMLVDSATWLAGYRRATGEGKSQAEAVAYADGIVENAQTSGMFSDRSAIERGTFSDTTRQSEFVKLWTTLGSYMIAKGNIAFESYRRTDFKSLPSVLAFGADMSLLFAVEALLMGVIKGGLPDDEDESWWAWTAKTTAEQAAGTIPIVREIPSFIRGYGAGGGPIGSTLADIGKAVNQTQQGEIDAALLKSYMSLIGTATGLPSAQTNRAIDAYWRESVDGEDVPAYEYVTGKRKD